MNQSGTTKSRPHVSLIVAVADNGVIGRGGQLPWRQPTDLKTFRRLTLDKPVIMGRKTFQSIGRPLDRRVNIVVSRDTAIRTEGVIVVSSLSAALVAAGNVPEIMIIGGAQLYRAAMPDATRIYLTRIHAAPEGDATFDVPSGGWREVSVEPLTQGPNDEFAATLSILERG
jgi:dihydrofolate reductase